MRGELLLRFFGMGLVFNWMDLHLALPFAFAVGKDTAAVEPHPLALLAWGGIRVQFVAVVP